MLEMDSSLTDALRADDAVAFARNAQKQEGFEPLVHCALRFAIEGVTSLAEVMSLSGQEEEFWEFTQVEHALDTHELQEKLAEQAKPFEMLGDSNADARH